MRFLCWLFGGHHTILRTEGRRVYTECLRCGRESGGWSYGDSYVGPRP